MYIGVQKTTSYASNKGSASNAVDYLEKENSDKEFFNQEQFFNHSSSNISGINAKKSLDNNKGKLGKNDTKFFMLTISPSADELKHIGNDNEKLKLFTQKVMDNYAENFNRNYKNGDNLTGNDLVYFAKIEYERTYKYSNEKDANIIISNRKIDKKIDELSLKKGDFKTEIKQLKTDYQRNDKGKIIKEGVNKSGDNRHIHVLVHRHDKRKELKLSPLSNARNTTKKQVGKSGERREVQAGFNRKEFSLKGEKTFDDTFNYKRKEQDKYKNKGKNKTKNPLKISMITNPIAYSKSAIKTAVLKEIAQQMGKPKMVKSLGYATSDPKKIPQKVKNEILNRGIKEVAKMIGSAANITPPTAAIKAIKDAFVFVGKQISKGAGI